MTSLLQRLLTLVAAVLIFGAACSGASKPTATLKVDLADVVATGVVTPVDGISAAGQPDKASLEVFARNGYTTVIDLRGEQEDRGLEEAVVVAELGMEYIAFPIAEAESINFENAKRLDQLIASAAGPVLLHCGSSNRVGAMLALNKSLEGADDDAALEYGRERGMTRLEGRVKEVLSEK